MVLQGVIRPPPEIRAVADRTALYVAKNGRAFESRILGSDKGKTPKFAFLQSNSPFHAYYEQRIQFYEEGGVDEAEEEKKQPDEKEKKTDGKAGDVDVETVTGRSSSNTEGGKHKDKHPGQKQKTKQQLVTTATKSVIDPVAKAVLARRSKIAQLRLQQEQQNQPQNQDPTKTDADTDQQQQTQQSQQQIRVHIPPPPPLFFINIVPPSALTVVQMETIQLVAQFTAMDRHFLQQLSVREWNNPIFAFCQPRHGHFCYFSALVDAYRQVLNTWTKQNHTNSNDEEDLTTVQGCLQRAAYRAEYERDLEQQHQTNKETVQINWHDFVVVETIDFPVDEVVEIAMMPPRPQLIPSPPPPPLPTATTAGESMDVDESEEEEEDEEDQEQIRLVPNYQPKVVGTHQQNKSAGSSSSSMMMIDPITGKSVAVEDMPEHMRIQLLDPKWAEQRKIFQEKQKDSNLVSGDVVASNLARLAHARGGGNKEHDFLTKESDSKKRLAEANRVIREQAVGPSLPLQQQQQQQHHHHQSQQQHQFMTRNMTSASAATTTMQEPDMKRPRITTIEAPPMPMSSSSAQQQQQTSSLLPPPPPPPPGFESDITGASAATSSAVDDPFAFASIGDVATATTAVTITASSTNQDQPSYPSGTAAAGGGGSSSTSTGPPQALMSESDFVASLASGSNTDVTLQIRIPNDRTQVAWNFYGQIVSHVANVMSTIKTVKQELSRVHLNSMPANKIQLKATTTGTFLKDNMTLAALNIGPSGATTLELVPRARGGRK